jgi:hypothetical protein
MAKLAKKRKVKKTSTASSNWYIGLMTMVAMGMSIISIYSIIIVLFGMLPGLIAMIIDQEPKKYVSKIVLSFNFTGLCLYLSKIIAAHESANSMAIEFIISPQTWLTIYSAAAVGWMVYWAFPYFAISLNNLKIQFRVQQLNLELEKLVQEWGDEIRFKNN